MKKAAREEGGAEWRTRGAVRGRGVALLRGVNLAAHKRMKMMDLVSVFEKCGCTEVATYIQSGNVVFTAPSGGIDAAKLEAAIEKKFGFEAPVVLRTAEELEAAIAATPYRGLRSREGSAAR